MAAQEGDPMLDGGNHDPMLDGGNHTVHDLKCSPSFSSKLVDLDVPLLFKCPISGLLITDPIVLSTTKTYDRPFIQRWLSEVQRINPKTKPILSHAILFSNYFVKEMIAEWCKEKASAWKAQLGAVVHNIVDDHDYKFRAIKEARVALSALEELKCCAVVPGKSDHLCVPPHFQCPISGYLMTDPVILSIGQTYDRSSIQSWINEVCVCPMTKQVLSYSTLDPNSCLLNMISMWCEKHGIELPKPFGCIADEEVIEAYRRRLNSLLHKLLFSVSDQKKAVKDLQLLAKTLTSFRTLLTGLEVIRQLLSALSAGIDYIDPELHECLIATVLNFSISRGNKREIAEDENVMSLLIDSLKSGTIQTRRNAATIIFKLSSLDDNKHTIGKYGAIKYLVELLAEEAMEEAVTAILELCKVHENIERVVQEGAIQVILSKIRDHVLVDDLLKVLELLSSHHEAVKGFRNHGAVPLLLDILKKSTSQCSKERCISVLHTIFTDDGIKLEEIRDDEIAIKYTVQVCPV